MMVILNSPDDGYSERTWVLNVPDDGYSERTWWWLFWAYLMMVILSVPDEGYSERHPMMVIPETRRAHYIRYLRFY